jgi:hypothetical protein
VPLRITDTDRGYKRALAALGPLGGVTLGVQGAKASAPHAGSTVSIGELAAIHELGLGVPERSWLRAWIDENQQMLLEDSKAAMQQVILGKLTKERALNVLGLKWVGAIQQRIADGAVTPALTPATVARKGSSVPLIDTGVLRASITHIAKVSTSLVGQLLGVK